MPPLQAVGHTGDVELLAWVAHLDTIPDQAEACSVMEVDVHRSPQSSKPLVLPLVRLSPAAAFKRLRHLPSSLLLHLPEANAVQPIGAHGGLFA